MHQALIRWSNRQWMRLSVRSTLASISNLLEIGAGCPTFNFCAALRFFREWALPTISSRSDYKKQNPCWLTPIFWSKKSHLPAVLKTNIILAIFSKSTLLFLHRLFAPPPVPKRRGMNQKTHKACAFIHCQTFDMPFRFSPSLHICYMLPKMFFARLAFWFYPNLPAPFS